MYDLAKMFLHCLNHWKLETPTARKQHAHNDDVSVYKVNYTRSRVLHKFLSGLKVIKIGEGYFEVANLKSYHLHKE